MTDWNGIYSETARYFGIEPDPIVREFAGALDRNRPALDIGAGQGRNALFLAREGLSVHALDPSSTAMRGLEAKAENSGLAIEVHVGQFAEYAPEAGTFGTILAMGLIPILKRDEVEQLARNMREWAAEGATLLVTAFTTADPAFKQCCRDNRPLGLHSFRRPDGTVRTFLAPGEAPSLFAGLEVLRHREGMGPEHRHGDGPPHRHGLVELALRNGTPG